MDIPHEQYFELVTSIRTPLNDITAKSDHTHNNMAGSTTINHDEGSS